MARSSDNISAKNITNKIVILLKQQNVSSRQFETISTQQIIILFESKIHIRHCIFMIRVCEHEIIRQELGETSRSWFSIILRQASKQGREAPTDRHKCQLHMSIESEPSCLSRTMQTSKIPDVSEQSFRALCLQLPGKKTRHCSAWKQTARGLWVYIFPR